MAFFKKKIVDERIQNLQNKIYREIYFIITTIAFISLLVKTVIYGNDFKFIGLELIILLVSSAYYLIRATYSGILSEEVEIHDATSKFPYSTKTIIIGILSGLVLALMMGLNSALNYADNNKQAVEYFFMVFGIAFIIYVPFLAIFIYFSTQSAIKKSKKRNEDMLEDDDVGETK